MMDRTAIHHKEGHMPENEEPIVIPQPSRDPVPPLAEADNLEDLIDEEGNIK